MPKCIISNKEIPLDILPLRITSDGNKIEFDLSLKGSGSSYHIYPSANNLGVLQKKSEEYLPSDFPPIPKDLIKMVTDIYEKKISSSIGFAIKSGRAVMGNSSISRFIKLKPMHATILIISSNASPNIANGFISSMNTGIVVEKFPSKLLKKLTGKEKISYLLLTRSKSDLPIFNSYKNLFSF